MTTDQSRQVPDTAVPPPRPGTDASSSTGGERSLGQIMGDIANDLTSLVRQELELARTELKAEAAKAGKGAGMFGGAGVSGVLALIFLSLAATFLLDNWMPTELAALIVGVAWTAAAAVLALRGKKELQQTNPQLPTTQRTLKEDVQWAKAQKS
jgi:uncharacterized membrane protein YqjE